MAKSKVIQFDIDYNGLDMPHLVLLWIVAISILLFLFFIGIEFTFGDKSFRIGGFLKILNRRDKENRLRETLRRKIEAIDDNRNTAINQIIDTITENISDKEQRILVGISLLRAVMYNHLEINLTNNNITIYKNRKVAESLGLYGNDINWQEVFTHFTDGAKSEIIKAYQAKIAIYELWAKLFKNPALKSMAINEPLERNQEKLAKMGATS
jgi:hypothetical protein